MRRTAILGAILLLSCGAVAAQGPGATADPVAAELARLNGTLREIAALLKQQSERADLDLLMKRLQLSEGRLAGQERALREAQSELRSLEHERGQIEMTLQVIEARIEEGAENLKMVEAEAAQAEDALKRVRQRIAQLTAEIAGFENEIASGREEVRSWTSVLDRRLSRQ